MHELLHSGEEKLVFGDAGYQGIKNHDAQKKMKARWHVATQPGKRRVIAGNPTGRIFEKLGQLKASVIANGEHPFHVITNMFDLRKVGGWGLAKNTVRLYKLLGPVAAVSDRFRPPRRQSVEDRIHKV